METGKPGLVSAPVHISSVAAQAEKRMDIQTPLRAVYIHTVPALPAQHYPQPPAAVREPATLHLAMPSLYSNETLPFLTIHIAGGLQSQAGLSVAAGAPASRPKSAGKHVCPHCGRDCMKPSVLEKHLRCHTGERPYPCATCGVSFKTQSNLYKHKRTQAHARLSSESEQSSLGSLDSMSSSRETCTSSLSLDEHADESESTERDDRLPATACPAHTTRAQGSTSEQNELATARQKTEPNESAKVRVEEEKQKVESEKAPLSVSRHLPLQRQEATLFSKQWESSVSGGKSQSHESTDSGFSESNDHYPSPASVLPDHSMDSLPESTKEHLEETTITDTASELGQGGQEPKDAARDQEQKTLVERISKLISENTAVVEDKQLDNVRPRKTVLSKQGSIDLPMPYTYKDSFHFDMKIGKTSNVGLQRNRAPGLYSSVPTQRSAAAEHVPLGRSNSLPFSVTLLQPEKSSPASSHHSDYATLVRRGSSGQITPSFTMKPVNQQSSTHRPLVRQTAVDCNHATDGHFINSSVEEAGSGSLSCDGDGGESCTEPSSRKFRRKKAQKFAYNKWYMYGGGTFKKLYNAEKSGDNTVIKSRKCLNPDLEVIQSPHKRLSAVHKEMATTAGVTSSSAVSPAGCPPAKPSFVHTSGMNCDLMSINSPLKAPLQRNLSLSGLPLSSVGSFVSLIKSNVSGTDTERLIHDGSTSLFRAHVPSDRKKQKTDDKAVFPVLNAVTHPLPSVTGRVPQQETNRTSVNFPENQKHTQVKDAVFLPRIIDANVPSVSASPAASVSSAAKTSFLPKYQLKLPNVTETDSNSSSHLADKPSTTDVCAFASSHTEQNSPLDTTSENACKESVFSPLSQTCDLKKTDAFSSTQTQCVPPGTTTLCPTKTSPLYESVTSSLPGAHRQFAATTVTTTCLKDDQAGICSTLVQPSKSAAGSALIRFPTRAAPVVANMPGRPTVNTANEDFVGHPTFNRPSSHSQPAAALNPATRAYVGQNTPAVPCNVAPFNQEQAVSQNIFHVHTADLQICLQLISDEQLALIEPQIEREAANSHPQRRDTEALAHVIQNKAQISEMSSEGRGRQLPGHQAETDQSGPLPTVNAGSKKPPLSVHFGKLQSNIHVSEPSDCSISAESKPPESLGLTLRPHTHSDVSTATEALSSGGDVVSTAASLIGEKHQTSHEEQSVNESQFLSQTLSCPPHLSMTCSSPSTVKQSSTSSDLLLKEGREKPQVAVAKGEGPARKSHRPQESGGTHSSVQVVVSQASGSLCADPPEDVDLCRQTHRGCDRAGPSNDAAPLQKTIPHGAKDSIDLAQAEEQLGPNAAASCKTLVEKPKDTPAVLPGFQSCAAGVMEAASPVACAGQTKPQDVGHGGTPGLPDSADGRRRLSRDAGGTNQQGAEGQGGESVMGEDEDGGVQAHQGEDLKVKEESFKNSWLSEQHLSQTHSGMCEYPPQSPQQAPSSSHNPSPSRRSHTSLFNLPQPPLDTNYFYFSQQQWESSVAHNYQTLTPCQSKLEEHIKAQARLTEAQRESSSQQTEILSHEEQQEQQQTMSIQQGNSIKGNSAAGSYCSRITLGSLSPGVKTSTDHFHVSPPAEGIKGTADWTGNSNNSDSGRSDTSNKYQPFLLTGHSFQPGECLNNGVRVVPNCQDYSEDTCSSDEEGKLIIEL